MIDVRPMNGGDLPYVQTIYRQYVGQPPPPTWLSTVSHALNDPSELPLAWVAIKGNEVVGYIVGEVRSWEFGSDPAGWVTGIGVAGDNRGDGVGKLLMEKLLLAFRARDAKNVRTMVRGNDVGVLRFFRSVGFTSGPYTQLEMPLERR